MSLPIRLRSKVVKGFQRGSRELGIPTANLSREDVGAELFDGLECGIYMGWASIEETGAINGRPLKVFKAAVSIGYNPHYKNTLKTCEPHLIAPPDDDCRHLSSCGETVMHDFYDSTIRLSVLSKIRDELPFESLEKLIIAIKSDIKITEEKLNDATDEVSMTEKEWCRTMD
mmetsp:Transcript_5032/g.9636  ORF Transcript_5032/g.9636 Transcript_5032/m.9636 type:complete len:172 (-) Transcript_5032:31-546(-)